MPSCIEGGLAPCSGSHPGEGAAETCSKAWGPHIGALGSPLSASAPGRLGHPGLQPLEVKVGFGSAAKRGRHRDARQRLSAVLRPGG